MRFVIGMLVVALMLICNALLIAQQPAQTCKDIPTRCDKELLLLRGEVDNKRQAIAVLLDANEQLQSRIEKAESRLKELEKLPAALPPDAPPPKD